MSRYRFSRGIVLLVLLTLQLFPLTAETADKRDAGDNGDLYQQLGEAFGAMGRDMGRSFSQIIHSLSTKIKSDNQLVVAIYAVLALIGIVLLFIVIFVLVQTKKNSHLQKVQQQRFQHVFSLVREMEESTREKEIQESEQKNQALLKELANQCEKLGERIDIHTNRPSNSKCMSELVFKIAPKLGVDKNTATIYFCAALVYDAGFLAIPSDFFSVEILSAKERMRMKRHVDDAVSYLDFVPREYWQIFHEAVTMHHENMNGTGYPEGLCGDQIPQIARLIRVVESYVSLISHRSYHKIRDKESALAELRRQPECYDMKIVDALEKAVHEN